MKKEQAEKWLSQLASGKISFCHHFANCESGKNRILVRLFAITCQPYNSNTSGFIMSELKSTRLSIL